tara:strand:+ start:417 stop:1202 length:786 start_codon:yes stop_codon:yes gene_type:complete
MGIISINEKRTSGNSTHTTGREVSYFTGDQFKEATEDPYISGKFYYYHMNDSNSGGQWGAFWDTGSSLENLTMVASNGTTNWDQRNSRWHTNDSSNWEAFTISLSDVTSPGRLVFYCGRDDSKFRSDLDYDDIQLHAANGTVVDFDPSDSDVRSDDLWQRALTTYSQTTYSGAKSSYPSGNDSSDWGDLPNPPGTITNGLWHYIKGAGGASGGTGSDNAADNNSETIYLYWEGSGGGQSSNNGMSYLRWSDRYSTSNGGIA